MCKFYLLVTLFCSFLYVNLDASAIAQTNESDSINTSTLVDHQPEYLGGDDSLYAFIGRNINFPRKARKQKLRGTVFVQFIIDKNGKVTQPKIIKDIGGGVGEEVLRVINLLPNWIPAVQKGKVVAARLKIPVEFKDEY